MAKRESNLIAHPGYFPRDEYDFSTVRGLKKYNESHGMDFANFIAEKNLQRGTIVDLGCGNGYFLRDLKKIYPGIKTIGVDRTLYENEIDEFVVSDIRKVPLKDGIADLVVSNLASQWIKDNRDKFFAEVGRLKKKNGYAFIFPALHSPDTFVDLFGKYYQLRNVRDTHDIVLPQLVLGDVSFN